MAFPEAEERDRIESLLSQGARISRLDSDPLVLDGPEPRAPALPAIPDQVNPAVAALLPQISSDTIYDTIADLSGTRSVWTGGQWQIIPTRYHWAGYNAVVQGYLYERYSSLGFSPVYSPWSYCRLWRVQHYRRPAGGHPPRAHLADRRPLRQQFEPSLQLGAGRG